MATIRRFEDIGAWQKARELTKQIYAVTKRNPFAQDYALRDQIRRASISVMSNIAEGFGRNSDREFANFLNIAIGSAVEVQSQLYPALDQGYIDQLEFTRLYDLAYEAIKMAKSLAQHCRNT